MVQGIVFGQGTGGGGETIYIYRDTTLTTNPSYAFDGDTDTYAQLLNNSSGGATYVAYTTFIPDTAQTFGTITYKLYCNGASSRSAVLQTLSGSTWTTRYTIPISNAVTYENSTDLSSYGDVDGVRITTSASSSRYSSARTTEVRMYEMTAPIV